MQQRVMTADRFYSDPYTIRKQALSAEYENNISKESYLNKEALDKICHMVQNNLEVLTTDASGKFLYQDSNYQNQQIQTHIEADWLAVVNLTLPNHCKDKTSLEICTHVPTGLECLPTEMTAHLMGYTCAEEILEGLLATDSTKQGLWSPWFTVFERYNRIVVLDAKLWHRQLGGYGDAINNCRLLQLFYLRNR